jgi:hypothetical protein
MLNDGRTLGAVLVGFFAGIFGFYLVILAVEAVAKLF